MRNSPWRTGSIHQASMQAVKHGFLTKWSYNGLSCTISPRARLTRIASSWGRFVDVAIESGATSRVGDAAAETLEVLFCRRPRARLLGRLHARLEKAIRANATPRAPWFVVPADKEWSNLPWASLRLTLAATGRPPDLPRHRRAEKPFPARAPRTKSCSSLTALDFSVSYWSEGLVGAGRRYTGRRRRTRVPPARIGSVSQATKNAQAVRDARNGSV